MLEIERSKVRLFTPTEVNAGKRESHQTSRNMRFTRQVACGQIWGNDTLLQARYRNIAYQQSAVPIAIAPDSIVETTADAAQSILADAARRAEARAIAAVEQEEKELKFLKTQAELDAVEFLQKLDTNAVEAETQDGEGFIEGPLSMPAKPPPPLSRSRDACLL